MIHQNRIIVPLCTVVSVCIALGVSTWAYRSLCGQSSNTASGNNDENGAPSASGNGEDQVTDDNAPPQVSTADGEGEAVVARHSAVAETCVMSLKDFRIIREIEKGALGIVVQAEYIAAQMQVAIKIINRDGLKNVGEGKPKEEYDIHSSPNHPNVIKTLGFFSDEDCFYVVMELAPGGDVLQKMSVSGPHGSFEESLAAQYVQGLVKGVMHCHQQGVVHGDIKLENILLDVEDNVKLCDFGSSTRMTTNGEVETVCGTLNYMAPEICDERGYDERADIWSIGVVMYAMLFGFLPFNSGQKERTKERIMAGAFCFPSNRPVSEDAMDLIECLLEFEPDDRLPLSLGLEHPSVQQHTVGERKGCFLRVLMYVCVCFDFFFFLFSFLILPGLNRFQIPQRLIVFELHMRNDFLGEVHLEKGPNRLRTKRKNNKKKKKRERERERDKDEQ